MAKQKIAINIGRTSGGERARLVTQLGFASLISGLGLGLSVLLGDGAGVGIIPFLFPVCVVSAWTGGMAGGSLATVILAFGAAYYHLPPAGLAVADSAHVLALGTFILTGLFIAWLVGALEQRLLEPDAVILEKSFDENDQLASVREVLDRKDSGTTSQ